MILAHSPTVSLLHTLSLKFGGGFNKSLSPLTVSPNYALCFYSKFSSEASPKRFCLKNGTAEEPIKETNSLHPAKQVFSVLTSDIPWNSENLWSTMASYMFNLHVPLGYGGLSIVAYILHQPILDPQTQALSLLVFQMLELTGALFLLSRTIKPDYDLVNFFKTKNLTNKRNWLLTSALGFGVLTSFIFLTSLVADRLFGAKAASDPIVKEILLNSNISKTALVLVDCIIALLLEEAVYRGFLLTSLASKMNWQHAVVISSAIFSAAHFSINNFLQLFIIGSVLGCSYCWSGNLASSIVIHSLYNALIITVTLSS